MAETRLEVTYDVEKALAALQRLQDELRSTGDAASEGFQEAEDAGERFLDGLQGALGRISPAAGRAVGEIRALASAYGVVGVAGAAAGVAIGSIAANLFNLPKFLNDANEDLERLNDSFDRLAQIQNNLTDFQFSGRFRQIEERNRGLDERAIKLAEAREITSIAVEENQRRVAIERDAFNQITQAARDSAQQRQTIEEQLTRILERRQARADSALPLGRQFENVLGRARQARESGDTQGAERFIQQAEQLAEQLGGHAFFTKQIAAEEDKLVSALQQAAAARAQDTAALEKQAAARKKNLDLALQEQETLRGEQRQQTNEFRNIRADRRQNSLDARRLQDEQRQIKAGQQLAASFNQLATNITTVDSGFTELKNRIKNIIELGTGNDVFAEQGLLNFAEAQRGKLGTQLASGDTVGAATTLQDLERTLAFIASNELSSGLQTTFDRLQQAVEIAKQIPAIQAERELAGASTRIPGQVPFAVAPQPAAQPQTVQGGTTTVNENVTVNIRGGMLDDETVRQIGEKLQRQRRQGVSN